MKRYRSPKQQNRIFLLSVIIFIVVVFLLLTYGLKLLLNTSLFVARLGGQNNSSESLKSNQNLIADVDITSLPDATGSAKIMVGGSVINFEQIEFYLNGDLVKEVTLLLSDNFLEEIGDLKDGDNEVFVIAKTQDGNEEKKSKIYNVLYKSLPPNLEISEPADNSKTNNQEIRVAGSTDKETYIKVNSLPVVVDAQGFFQTTIKLMEGQNQIEIIAQDIAQNLTSRTLTVNYEKE